MNRMDLTMQLDRLVTKTMSRLAWSGFRRVSAGATGPKVRTTEAKTPGGDLRGSGSWANEWAGARNAVERARAMAKPGRDRKARAKTDLDSIPEGTIRVRPLMTGREVKLHNWIADRLEAEAPVCTLHAGVSLKAFLSSDIAREDHDPLSGMVADLLIADEKGQPVAALIRENTADPTRHLLMLDALLDADIPIVDIPSRPSLSALWADISATLPVD